MIAQGLPTASIGTQRAVRAGREVGRARSGAVRASAVASSMTPKREVIEFFRTCDAVAFDVDSTVCVDEGIDELAKFVGAGEKVEAITKRAMEGGMPFGEALQLRLEAMTVSQQQVEMFLKNNPPKFSPGIKELVATLKANGKEVYLVSGGFRQMIDPVAKELGIPSENVQANTLTFNEDGSFKGYDPREFTSIAGGKADAVKHIKGSKGYKSMVMVGDGATDVEARTPGGADMVIGYGGAQRRARVEAEADWYVLNLFDLVNVF